MRWLGVLAMVCLSGCARSGTQTAACVVDQDCARGEYCVRANEQGKRAGTCISGVCKSDSECANDHWCSPREQCEVRRAGTCERDRMCPVGLHCKGLVPPSGSGKECG